MLTINMYIMDMLNVSMAKLRSGMEIENKRDTGITSSINSAETVVVMWYLCNVQYQFFFYSKATNSKEKVFQNSPKKAAISELWV